MILPTFVLPYYANKIFTSTGIDSIDQCFDKNYFNLYPYDVNYQYNSRGFRDSEWPVTNHDLQNAIWCFGDSFTVGLGSTLTHTWVNLLQKITGKRCINISMNGASNTWIARRAIEVLETIKPKNIVIHWSYLWRGENPNTLLDDTERLIAVEFLDELLMTEHYIKLVSQVSKSNQGTNIIHSVIPGFSIVHYEELSNKWNILKGSNWPTCPKNYNEFKSIPNFVSNEIDDINFVLKLESFVKLSDFITNTPRWIQEFKILDFARDKFHYDIKTAEYFVSEIISKLQFDRHI